MPASLLAGAALLVGVVIGYLAGAHVVPSVAHILFIPSVLLVGVVFGFVFGGRATRDAVAGQERAAEAKAARRAARDRKR